MVVVQLALVAFVGLGLVAFVYGTSQFLVGWRIHTSQEDTVSDATAGGRVDLEGTARTHEETLEAPVSGRDCLGYEYTVEEHAPSGRGSDWNTVDDGGTTVPFLLDTETGTVLVSDENPSLAINDDRKRVRLDSDEDVPGPVQRFVERNHEVDPVGGRTLDLKLTEVHTGRTRRYTEYALVPGETAYVAGVGESPAGAGVPVPREASALIRAPGGVDTSGVLGRAERRLWPLSFLVADSPMSDSRNDYLRKGAGYLLFGLVFAGIPLYLVVRAFISPTF
jgi:hypothetical protein